MRIASAGPSPLPSTTTGATAQQLQAELELPALPQNQPLPATVKAVQPGKATLDLGGTLLNVLTNDNSLQPGAKVIVRFNDAGRGTVDLGDGKSTTVALGTTETAPPEEAPAPTRPRSFLAAAFAPVSSTRQQPVFSAPVVRAEIVQQLPDGQYLVRVDGKEIKASTPDPINVGSKQVVRIESTPQGVVIRPVPVTPQLPREVATATLRAIPVRPGIGQALQAIASEVPVTLPPTRSVPTALPTMLPSTPVLNGALPSPVTITAPISGPSVPVNLVTSGQPIPFIPPRIITTPTPIPASPTTSAPTAPPAPATTTAPLPPASILPALLTALAVPPPNGAPPAGVAGPPAGPTPVVPATTIPGPLTPTIQGTTNVEVATTTRAAIPATPALKTMVEQLIGTGDAPPSAERLEAFVRDGGMLYEAKLGRIAQSERPDAEAIREVPKNDLKGGLLEAIRSSGGVDADPKLHAALDSIESQQALNILAATSGEGVRLQFPIPDGQQWRTLDVTFSSEAEGEQADGQPGQDGYSLFMHTELSDFGDTWIDARVTGKSFRAVLYIESAEARDRVRGELKSLATDLGSMGFGHVLLDVKGTADLPNHDRARANAMRSSAPVGTSLLDVRA